MKTLILGARGNLGEQLAKAFGENRDEIVGWDKDNIDITDKDLILKKIKDVRPDVIINATGYNAVDKCEAEKREYELAKTLNAEAVGYLVEAALDNEAILVNYSSDYVFDGGKKRGYKENDRPAPISNYGKTKLLGEQEIITKSGQGLKWYLIRTSKLFGPCGASALAKPSFFDLMLQLSREKNELEAIDGEISCFTYTPDLARATLSLIKNRKGYGIYHLTNSGPASWYEAAQELFRLAGIKTNLKPVPAAKFPRPAKRPAYSILLNTKTEPLRDWKDALKEYLDKTKL